jgi:hypothetical protein
MNKKIATLALFGLLTSAALPVAAQDAGAAVGVNAGGGVSVETPSVDASGTVGASGGASTSDSSTNVNAGANANAGASAQAGSMADNTYGSVMAALSAGASVDLGTVNDDTTITIIALSSLQGNADSESAALDTQLSADAEAHTALHSDIAGNASLMATLEAEGYAADDVIALKSAADGSLIVYVDDRA